MVLLSKANGVIIFILLSIIIIIISIFFFWPLISKTYKRKHFKKSVYNKIRSIADRYDFYLINNFPLLKNEEVIASIDHALYSNKYIYLIKSKHYKDVIAAHRDDKIWLQYDNKGNKEEITNPLILNKLRCDTYCELRNSDRSFLISIVVVNNDVKIKNLAELSSFNSYFVKEKDLKKLIKKIEKRNVSNFNEVSLEKEVKSIAKEIGRIDYEDE